MKTSSLEGWTVTSLENIADILDNIRVPVNSDERAKRQGDVPYYGATGQVGWINDFLFNEEIVLVGEDAAPFFDKSKNVAFLVNGKSWVNNHAHVIRAKSAITSNKYLLYFLNNFNYKGYVNGTTRLKLTQGSMKTIPVLLPPLAEQNRIVAQLEAIMQKLDASQERLEKLPMLLKKFRQAVLAAAVSGKLTEAWRAEQPELESAEIMLEEIIEGRKLRFARISAEAKSAGRKAPRKVFAEQLTSVDTALIPEIPDNWTTTTVGFLAHVTKLAGFEYTNYIKYENVGEVPVVRAQNVQMGRFSEENLVYIDEATSDFLERSQLHGREVLMVFIGAGTGNVCLAPKDRRWHLAPNVAKIDCDVVLSEYLNFYLQSPVGLRNTLSFIKATAQPSLSMETIREIAVALPGMAEQREIIRQINHYFALADQLEARFEQAAAMVEQLPQALLAKAFSGQLVPQDPSDEPASALLERLQSSAVAPAKGTRGRKPKATSPTPLFN